MDASGTTDVANSSIPPNIIMFLSTEDVISGDGYSTDLTRNLIKEVKDSVANEPKKEVPPVNLASDNKKVFVVHGHDNAAKSEMARFFERRIWGQSCCTSKQAQAERLLKKLRQIVTLDMQLSCTHRVT